MHDDLACAEPVVVSQGLRGLFNRLERHRSGGLDGFVEEAFAALRTDLRLRGVLVYAERREGFELRKRFGDHAEALAPWVPFERTCLEPILRHRVYIFGDPYEEGTPWTDGVLPCLSSAGVVVGRRPHRHVLFFLLEEGWDREQVDFALNVLRAAVGLQVLEEKVQKDLRETAEIQEGLLREQPPGFPGFEIACRSVPAEDVSGDFCDFVHVGGDLVAFAIGDASGHGLPAAMVVRDVVTGLRMGLEKHLRMEYVFAKLNRVIHRSNPASRYASLFYGELESNGNLNYINAGHQPPLLFRSEQVLELRTGGTVIGPLPEVYFRRGFVRLDPRDILVLFTDGVIERRGPDGEFFGEERLRSLVQASPALPAALLLDRLLDEARAYGGRRPWEDDVTAMVIRRLED